MTQTSLFATEVSASPVVYRKPMLSAKIKTSADFGSIVFPVWCSPKLDGIRQTEHDTVCLSRTLKPLPNRNLQRTFGSELLNGLDGEFIDGPLTAPDVFSRTDSVVMSADKPTDELSLNIFDDITDPDAPFIERLQRAKERVASINAHWPLLRVQLVEHVLIHNMAELLAYEESQLDKGYEGVMLRRGSGLHKQGRSTLKEGGLAAIKRFTDTEGIIQSVFEQEKNTNEKQTNELGMSKRSSTKSGKVGKDTLGGFTVVVNPDDAVAVAVFGVTPFNVGTGEGLTKVLRQQLWTRREDLIGRIVKFKYQATGTKDKPRLPIFLGFRNPMDMGS